MEEKRISFYKATAIALGAGALAGWSADLVTHSLDTCRARLQVQRANGAYRGTFDAFKTILSKEGIRGLYRGFGVVALFTVPAHALYFGGYEFSKMHLEKDVPLEDKSTLTIFTSGMVAEVCGALVWTPMDVIKQKLQVKRESTRTIDIMREVYVNNGFKGYYRGFVAGLLTYCPFVGIYFTSYEWMKKTTRRIKQQPLGNIEHVVCGGLSGAVASCVTTPIDVLKTRIQVSTAKVSFVESLKELVREEGIKGFGKGMVARVMWIAPGCAITLGCYEFFKGNIEYFVVS